MTIELFQPRSVRVNQCAVGHGLKALESLNETVLVELECAAGSAHPVTQVGERQRFPV